MGAANCKKFTSNLFMIEKIFIDFDDVVFNTKQFKDDFRQMFVAHGISGEIFDKHYNDPNDSRAIKTFDPWKQTENIGKELEIDTAFLAGLVDEFISGMARYLFDDVSEFVKAFGKENIWVVSFGECDFQTKKVMNSGIEKYVSNIVVTENLKSKAIGKILEKKKEAILGKIFFLDDRLEQIKDVKEKFPKIHTILVKRPEGRYQEMQKDECCDYEAHNLLEAEKIIKKRLAE